MADVQSNIHVNIDTSDALASLKLLQRQISAFHTQMAKSGTAASAVAANQAQNLINSINATGQFQASMRTVTTSTEQFTDSLERNKLTSREYFRYTGAATKTFGRLFRSEFETINKVARERVKDIQTQYIKMGRGANGALQAIAVRPLTLDMKNLGTQTAMAAQRQQLLNQLLKQGSTNLLNFGKNTQWAGRQLMVGFTIPLMLLGSTAAKTFMQLEEQAIRFKRVYGEMFTTKEETDKMVSDIQLLAKEFTKYGVAVEKTMEMAANAAAMGKMGAELKAQVMEATRLAVLGGVEQEQALETTISVTNAFGVAAADLAKKIDFLNAVENQTVVSIEDLTIAIPKAGPVVQQLGGDVEDLAFFLTAMKEGGINASEGANALKSGLASLINPSEKASKMLQGLGINIKGIVEANSGDVKSTVVDFAAALDTLDPLNRARAIEQLFGKFQFSRLSTLFQNVTKEGTQASRVLKLANATTEELAILSERELARVEDSTTYKFKKTIEDLKVSLAPVGEQFLKALTPIVEFVGKVLEKFNGLSDGSKKFVTILTIALGAVGPVALMTFGLLANGVANIIKLFASMKMAFNRTGSSTRVLGQQTDYLTQQQLEASAVAASLDQVHQRLTQRFTSETAAVNALALAYRNAVAAQVGFTGPVRGGGIKGSQQSKKYSTGITKVPGTGNQDTVPAMLTPGEAVIPADVAQDPRFKPIINSMVNKRLQGFNGGTSAVVAFGAHQPFTTAHESIAAQAQLLAKETGTDFIQYTSEGTQSKKGVVSLENRLKQIEESTGKPAISVKDPFALMEDLKNKGIKDVKILLGTDRMQNDVFDLAAKKYGLNLEKIEVLRTLDEKNVSSTKIREAIVTGNIEEAERLIAKGTSEETKKLIFDEIKANYKPAKPKKEVSTTQFAHAVDKIVMPLDDVPERFAKDVKILKGIGRTDGANLYTAVGFDIDKEVHSAISKEDITDKDGNIVKKQGAPVESYIEELKKPRAVETMTANLMKPPTSLTANQAARVTNRLRTELLSELSILPEGTIINDKTIYSKMGDAKSGILGALAQEKGNTSKAVKALLEPQGISGLGTSKKVYSATQTVEDVIKRLEETKTNPSVIKTFKDIAKFEPGKLIDVELDENMPLRKEDPEWKKIIGYDRPELSGASKNRPMSTWKFTKKKNAAVYDPETDQFNPKRSTPDSGGLGGKLKAKLNKKAKAALYGDVDPKFAVTEYKEHIAKGTGYSNVIDRDVSGLYETKDGKKVFVKPMINLENALAEQRATRIARQAHNLEAPEQRLVVIENPQTGKKSYALESPFEERFASGLKDNFTKEEYFKQLVASALRGDKDLAKGNLGGNALTDVGTAGIYDEASQYNEKRGEARVVSKQVRDFAEQAKINVGGVPGSGAKSDFYEATKHIPAGMTADEYSKAMNDEIDRVLPQLREAVEEIIKEDKLTPKEAKPYKQMIKRLEAARNLDWREVWAMHKTAGKVAVMPDEMIENTNTEQLRKPPSEPLPSGVQSSGGKKDTRMIDAPKKGEQVVQGPKPASTKRVGKFTIKGKSDAPLSSQELKDRINTEFSQSKAASSRTALYGSGPIDPEQKSLRRQLDKLNKNGKKLSTVASQVAVTQKVVTDNMTENVKKQGLAARLQARLQGLQEKYNASKTARATAKAAGTAKPGVGMGGAAMGIAGVAMMGSMVPGAVGETMTKLMMPLMGLSMILPMLGNKMGLVTVAAMAVVGAIVKLRMEFDKAQDEAIKLSNTMGSGKDAIRGYAKFAGNVSAGEIMERRSKEKFGMLGAKPGKTTFGESFVQGETGKALMASTTTRLKAGDQKGATEDLTNQLMTSVLSGAIDSAQAKSIALNIGQQVGNYGLGFAVTANINEIIGPNGENLKKDPLKVRMDLINEKTTQTNNLFDQMQKKSGFNPLNPLASLNSKAGVALPAAVGGIGMLAGARSGAIAGTRIGSFLGPKGALIGAGIGTIAGAGIGYMAQRNQNKKTASMSGAVVGSQRAQLEQQQELTDSLDLYYQKKIRELEIEGKIGKAKEEQKKYDDAKIALADKAKATNESILAQYGQTKGNVRSAMDTGIEKMISQRYEGTDEVQYLDASNTLLADSGLTKEQQYLIKVKMSTGELTPSQQVFLFSNFGNDKEVKQNYMDIITNFSARTGDEATRVMGMFTNPDGTPNTTMQAEFIGNVSTQTSDKEASKYIDFFAQVANTNGVFDMTASLNYYMANPKVAERAQGIIDNIEKNKGNLELNVMTNFLPANVMGAIDEEYFNKLSQAERLTYLKEIATIVSIPDPVIEADPEFKKWDAAGAMYNGDSYAGKPIGERIAAYRQFQPWKVSEESQAQAATIKKEESKGTGTGPAASPLDDLLKKIRDVRKGSVKVPKGFDASLKSLNNLFGGNKTIQAFSGIENQMRSLGAGEDLIELIAGMDPEEFEKQKNKLFKIENGKIVALKDSARSVGDALQSIALGDFVSTQDKMVKNIGNQNAALTRLKAAGVDGSVALEMVADAGTAAAIANNKLSDAQLKRVIKSAKEGTKALRRFAAVKGIEGNTSELEDTAKLYTKLTEDIGKYSQAEIEAILNNPALVEGLLLGASNFAEGLEKELERKQIELNLKVISIEGLQDIFDSGVGNAMESFAVKEEALRIDFDIKNKPLTDEIQKAEEQIALNQEKIRKEEIGLKEIQDQEEKVNEKYDERLYALDQIEKANSSVSQQQKGQLTLAEALTSGDIAAAARAAQEMRAQQAADNITKQKEALEQSREYELSQIKSKDGRSRIEIEKEIKKLQEEIYEIEEKSLEPNRETLRLNQLALDKAIAGIDVLGKTKGQWDAIKSAVDLARISSAAFIKDMEDAINSQQKLINAYKNQKVETKPIVPVDENGNPIVSDEDKINASGLTETEISNLRLGDEGDYIMQNNKKVGGSAGLDLKYSAANTAAADAKAKAAADAKAKAAADAKAKAAAEAARIADKKISGPAIIAAQKEKLAALQSQYDLDLARMQAIVRFDGGQKGAAALQSFEAKYPNGRPIKLAMGGIVPKMFALGGFAKGTDTVPAMLTPGEFVMSKYAVDAHGVNTMKAINNGQATGGAVYNNTYTLTVNAKTNANPNEIAQAVMSTIKQVDDRRVRGVAINAR